MRKLTILTVLALSAAGCGLEDPTRTVSCTITLADGTVTTCSETSGAVADAAGDDGCAASAPMTATEGEACTTDGLVGTCTISTGTLFYYDANAKDAAKDGCTGPFNGTWHDA